MLSNQSVGRVLGPRDFSRVSTGHMFARIWHRFYVFAVVSYILCDLSDWPKTLLLSCTVTSRNISTWILQLTFGFVSQTTRLSLNAIQVDTVAESGRTIAMADSEAAFASSCNRHLAWRNKKTKTLQTFVDHENPALITGSIL